MLVEYALNEQGFLRCCAARIPRQFRPLTMGRARRYLRLLGVCATHSPIAVVLRLCHFYRTIADLPYRGAGIIWRLRLPMKIQAPLPRGRGLALLQLRPWRTMIKCCGSLGGPCVPALRFHLFG